MKNNIGLTVTMAKSANVATLPLQMNITLKNLKTFSRLFTVIIGVLIIVCLPLILYHWKEVQILKTQMDHLNTDVLRLMSKYNKLNQNINRAWFRRTHHYDCPGSIGSTIRKFSDLSKVYRNDSTAVFTTYPDLVISLSSDKSINRQNIVIKNDDGIILNVLMTPLMKSKNRNNLIVVDQFGSNKQRNFRSLVSSAKNLLILETQNHAMKDQKNIGNVTNSWIEPQGKRLRRDNGRGGNRGRGNRRGKKREQNKRPKCDCRRLGPLVATFVGAKPEQTFNDKEVYIGPWVKSNDIVNNFYNFTKFYLDDDNMSINVTANGLYMISIQISYHIGKLESATCSYWILLTSKGASKAKKLNKCSTNASDVTPQISCYMSVITYLKKSDKLKIQQEQKNRC